MIRLYGPGAITLFAASAATPVEAQLLSERVDGLLRVCVYAPRANMVTSNARREYRVGIGQNCPFSYPVAQEGTPPPPSAQLQSETVADGRRACVYAQAGTTWTLSFELSQACPLHAGIAARRRASGP